MQLAEAQRYLRGQAAAIWSPAYSARLKVQRTVQVPTLREPCDSVPSAFSTDADDHRMWIASHNLDGARAER